MNIAKGLGLTALGGGLAYTPYALYQGRQKRIEEAGHKAKQKEMSERIRRKNTPTFGEFYDDSINSLNQADPGTQEADPMYHLGRGVSKYGKQPFGDTIRAIKDNPYTAALVGAILGVGGGGLWGLFSGKGMMGGAMKGGLLGGGGLLLANALGHYFTGDKKFGFGKDYVDPRKFYNHDPMGPNEYPDLPDKAFPGNKWQNQGMTDDEWGSRNKEAKLAKEPFKKTFKKTAAWGSGSSNQAGFVTSNIYNSGIPMVQQIALAREVAQLPPQKVSMLSKILAGATGAAAAYLIARFLLGMGSKSRVVMAVLGGAAGTGSNTLRGLF